MRFPTRLFIVGSLILSFGIIGYLLYSAVRDFGLTPSILPAALRPDASGSDSFSFLVMGDNEGDNPIFRSILEAGKASSADFLVNVADLTPRADPADFSSVKRLLGSLPFPYYTAVGNNDIFGDPTRSRYVAEFSTAALGLAGSDRTYYSFDHKNTHFVVLDNADRKEGFSDDELAWLQTDLTTAKAARIFLFMHRPVNVPLTDLYGDDETKTSRASNDRFVELVSQFPITRIFAGHIHTFFSYSIGDIPVTITGGGGAAPQTAIASLVGPYYHYLEIRVTNDSVEQVVHRIEE